MPETRAMARARAATMGKQTTRELATLPAKAVKSAKARPAAASTKTAGTQTSLTTKKAGTQTSLKSKTAGTQTSSTKSLTTSKNAGTQTSSTTRTLDEDQARLAKAKRSNKDLREALKQRVCVAPEYPGKPEDYSYVPHFCVARRNGKGSGVPRKPKATVSAADTQREIRVLEKAIEGYGKGYQEPDIELTNIQLMTKLHDKMLETKERIAFPDPVLRYDDLISRFVRGSGTRNFVAPRYTVFTLVLGALKALHA